MPNASLLIPLELQPSLNTRCFMEVIKEREQVGLRIERHSGSVLVFVNKTERDEEVRSLLMHLNELSVRYQTPLKRSSNSIHSRNQHTHTHLIPLIRTEKEDTEGRTIFLLD